MKIVGKQNEAVVFAKVKKKRYNRFRHYVIKSLQREVKYE